MIYSLTASLVLLYVPDDHAAGFVPGFPYCFLGPTYDKELVFGLYEWPLYFGMIVVCICCVPCMIRIAVTASVNETQWETMKQRFRPQMTIFLFLMLWLIVVAATIVFAGDVWNKESIPRELAAWMTCVLTTPGLSEDCPDVQGFQIDIIWWSLFMNGTIGFFYSLIFLFVNPTQQRLFCNAWENYKAGDSIFVRGAATTRSSKRSNSNLRNSNEPGQAST